MQDACRPLGATSGAVLHSTPLRVLFDFHGIPMIKMFTDNWDNVQDIKVKPNDVLIATYPKAGEVLPDLAPSHYYLFRNLKPHLCG
uniref:Uncharacterized protein n=1 Tax=Stegastes partitus TaxID=144197 RepID=A0A3B5ALN8_9TELE